MVTDRDTGRPRGFCFVEMTNDAAAQRGIAAINGKDIGGRTVKVDEARPKNDRENSRYRRGGVWRGSGW